MIDELLSLLKSEYNLKSNHLKILKVLETKKLNAYEISAATKIPMGRIYSFLNEMVEKDLILKDSTKQKAIFYIDNIERRLRSFVDLQATEILEKKARLIRTIENEKTNVNIHVIKNPVEYYLERMKLDSITEKYDWVCTGIFLPEIFYPGDARAGLRAVQRWFRKYEPLWSYSLSEEMINNLPLRNFNSLLEKGVKIRFLIEKEALVSYFKIYSTELGKNKAIEKINELKHLLNKYKNLQIRLTNDTDIDFGLSGGKVFFNIFNKFFNLILVIEDKDSYNLYESLFERSFNRIKDNVLEILDEISKSL